MKKQPLNLAYYDFSKIYSFNGVYNFLIGARGLGKSYGAKKQVIRNFFKDGQEFVLLRRYKDELKLAKPSFFADIAHEFPDYDFRVHGQYAECSPKDLADEKKRPWRTMGYFVALSSAQSMKGVSFPDVTTIIFDEFIIEKGMTHYLPNEAVAFTNFFSTVDRNRDKTKVFFLANSVSITNPYFLEYNIKPDQVGEFYVPKQYAGFIVVHFADSADFKAGVMATRFGQFIANTEYADYAVGNEFGDANDNMVSRKTIDANYLLTLETTHGTMSVWSSKGIYYMQERLPKQQVKYTMIPGNLKEGWLLMPVNSKMLQLFRAAFTQGRMWFDGPQTRNAFIEIFKR